MRVIVFLLIHFLIGIIIDIVILLNLRKTYIEDIEEFKVSFRVWYKLNFNNTVILVLIPFAWLLWIVMGFLFYLFDKS